MHAVAAQFRQFLGAVGLAVVRQHQAAEGHLVVGHGVEEHAQLFRRVVAGEHPDEFLVFQFPQFGVVRFVGYVGRHGVHEPLHGMGGCQLVAVFLCAGLAVRVEVGQDALLRAAYGVVEPVHQQGDVAQGCSAALAHAGDEHHFAGAKDFVVEQRAGNPDVPRAAEDKVVGIRVIVPHGGARRVALHFEVAIGGELVAERRFRLGGDAARVFFVFRHFVVVQFHK